MYYRCIVCRSYCNYPGIGRSCFYPGYIRAPRAYQSVVRTGKRCITSCWAYRSYHRHVSSIRILSGWSIDGNYERGWYDGENARDRGLFTTARFSRRIHRGYRCLAFCQGKTRTAVNARSGGLNETLSFFMPYVARRRQTA